MKVFAIPTTFVFPFPDSLFGEDDLQVIGRGKIGNSLAPLVFKFPLLSRLKFFFAVLEQIKLLCRFFRLL